MYRNVLCLVLGAIIGVSLTDFWDYFVLPSCNELVALDLTDAEQSYSYDIDNDGIGVTELQLNEFLFEKTRVLCFVLTMPKNHKTKAIKLKESWGSRCNKLIFISSEDDAELGAINFNVSEGRGNLWKKTRAALNHIYEHYADDYDWFFKADDDTYAIMENLRYFLYPFATEEPVYFGCRLWVNVHQGYMSGGAGYVLSRDALRRYNLFAKNNTLFCNPIGLSEDKELGRCLQNVGVVAGDSRDELGRERFMALAPRHLIPKMRSNDWLSRYLYFKPNVSDCCADTAITFHYTKENEFEFYDYLIYKLRAFGMSSFEELPTLPARLNITQMKAQLELWSRTQSSNHQSTTKVLHI